ncbi:hypothetical protein B0J12DRAFT_695396 [Macrophomina phaseolina]|uniref:Uncharacterized protein n=1 Tax=Macrophomina phaseolina TaxID=35725 RepID=A0ABQ8GN78_9PEZI|nr:hypothetical protein B0J12DRAFT_695396 [Macrophomina phaseolina]
MAIRKVEIPEGGSPVRTPSRCMNLPEMSQLEMISDRLHTHQSMEQLQPEHQQHRGVQTEGLDRESPLEETNDEENTSIRRLRSSISSSHRTPLGEVSESDPRRSSEQLYGSSPLMPGSSSTPPPARTPPRTTSPKSTPRLHPQPGSYPRTACLWLLTPPPHSATPARAACPLVSVAAPRPVPPIPIVAVPRVSAPARAPRRRFCLMDRTLRPRCAR